MGSEPVSDEQIKKILDGFHINWMNMRDARSGALIWEQDWPSDWKTSEVVAEIPASIMTCKEVSRELNFTSAQEIKDFSLTQRVFLGDMCLEEWCFDFGFVIPNSTNAWQSTIEAADEQDMLKPAEISGLMRIETSFMTGDTEFNKSIVRIFYV
mmetsp:Transcript_11947/g.20179  ORF Transcript_11947/g.20179 Transcript_11947/m.20179 type:complete len:154 (+) Transcript_11947:291-752(+)